jgi:simple sugar transport system permease protein
MTNILRSTITIMTPLLFASAGGLFPALTGTLNIALEGLILMGAFSSLAVFYHSGSYILALCAAAASGLALCGLHAFTAFRLRANIFITGLAVNLLSGSLCLLLSDIIFKTKGVTALQNKSSTGGFIFAAPVVLAIVWLIIYKTPFGFRLRTCEKSGEALISLGLHPQRYKIASMLISGVLCAMGGSFLSLHLGAFVPGMSAGRGWIALALIFLGGKKPQGILCAAFLYSLAEAFSNHLQGLYRIPVDFVLALPYVVTLIALILNKGRDSD